MSEGRRALAAVLTTMIALSLVRPARADEDLGGPSRRALTPRDVVSAVVNQNPTVLVTRDECWRAALDVEGETARYPLTLQLDASGTHTTDPQLAPGTVAGSGSVTTPTEDMLDAGAQLKQHLVWGTDLTLRFDATRDASTSIFLYSSLGTQLASLLHVDPAGVAETPIGPGYGAALKLTAVQPLLRGAGRAVAEAELRIARAQLTTAEFTRQQTASEVLRDALTAYWELWYATAAVDIERRARDTARKQSDDASGRIQTGSLAPADGLTFETQVATREEDVVKAESERNRRAADLGRLVGRAEDPGALGTPPEGPPEPAEWDADLRTEALEASPKLRELAGEVSVASVQAETAGDFLRPRLDVDGYVQAQGLGYNDVPAAFRQFGGFGAVSAHVGLTFELPLDDTRHRTERDRAFLEIEAAKQRLEEGRQQVLASLESARQSESSARRRVTLAEQTRELALRQANAERARFASGASTALQVLQAEDAVRAAELRAARARTDLAQGHLGVAHLVGRLYRELTQPGAGVCAGP